MTTPRAPASVSLAKDEGSFYELREAGPTLIDQNFKAYLQCVAVSCYVAGVSDYAVILLQGDKVVDVCCIGRYADKKDLHRRIVGSLFCNWARKATRQTSSFPIHALSVNGVREILDRLFEEDQG